MKKLKSSGSSIFLMEIILNVLLFSILLCICLQFIMKSHSLTEKTTQLERAVTVCSNVASIYESCEGSMDEIMAHYPDSMYLSQLVIIYLDEQMNPCESDLATYTVTISPAQSNTEDLSLVDISCEQEGTIIYQIQAGYYEKRLLGNEGGGTHE